MENLKYLFYHIKMVLENNPVQEHQDVYESIYPNDNRFAALLQDPTFLLLFSLNAVTIEDIEFIIIKNGEVDEMMHKSD